MKKSTILGAAIGFALGTAAAITGKMAVDKVVGEIREQMRDQVFTSPDGDHKVTVKCGTSKSAKGLSYMRVIATSETVDDECKLSMIARKRPLIIVARWDDNDHCKLSVGNGKRNQCCDVSFEENHITARYYLSKTH